MPEFVAKMGTAEGDVIERVYLSDNADALRRDLDALREELRQDKR